MVYADDFIAGFQYKWEAEEYYEQLQERMKKFGLELESSKSRLLEFGRYAEERRKVRGEGKPETFDDAKTLSADTAENLLQPLHVICKCYYEEPCVEKPHVRF